jgi:hypothetical protein
MSLNVARAEAAEEQRATQISYCMRFQVLSVFIYFATILMTVNYLQKARQKAIHSCYFNLST